MYVSHLLSLTRKFVFYYLSPLVFIYFFFFFWRGGRRVCFDVSFSLFFLFLFVGFVLFSITEVPVGNWVWEERRRGGGKREIGDLF